METEAWFSIPLYETHHRWAINAFLTYMIGNLVFESFVGGGCMHHTSHCEGMWLQCCFSELTYNGNIFGAGFELSSFRVIEVGGW